MIQLTSNTHLLIVLRLRYLELIAYNYVIPFKGRALESLFARKGSKSASYIYIYTWFKLSDNQLVNSYILMMIDDRI